MEHVEQISNDVEVITNVEKMLKETILLHKIQQKITIIQRNRLRNERINNLTVNIQPPTYNEAMDLLDEEDDTL